MIDPPLAVHEAAPLPEQLQNVSCRRASMCVASLFFFMLALSSAATGFAVLHEGDNFEARYIGLLLVLLVTPISGALSSVFFGLRHDD